MISFIDFPRSERETTLESSLSQSVLSIKPTFYFYYQSSFIIPIRALMEFPKIE